MPFPLTLRSPRQLADELYPAVTPAGSPLPVFLDRADGSVRDVTARSLKLRTQRGGHVRDGVVLRGGLDLLLTDARLVITGGRPTPDSVLAGHVPLDWIVAVGGSSSGSLFRNDALRLVVQIATGEYRVLTFTFDTDLDVHELAQDLARRTARHWLEKHGGGDFAHRWHVLASAERLSAPDGEFALHAMPEHRRVPGPARGVEQLCVPA